MRHKDQTQRLVVISKNNANTIRSLFSASFASTFPTPWIFMQIQKHVCYLLRKTPWKPTEITSTEAEHRLTPIRPGAVCAPLTDSWEWPHDQDSVRILYPSLASMQLDPLVIHLVVSPLSVHSHSNPSACQKQQLIFQQLDSKTIMNKPEKKANIKGHGVSVKKCELRNSFFLCAMDVQWCTRKTPKTIQNMWQLSSENGPWEESLVFHTQFTCSKFRQRSGCHGCLS